MMVQPRLPAAHSPAALLPCEAGSSEACQPLAERLAASAAALIRRHADPTQTIAFSLAAAPGHHGSARRETQILEIAEALIVDVLEHAMHMRLRGTVQLSLTRERGDIQLLLTHDGWDMETEPSPFWLQGAKLLTRMARGRLTLRRTTQSHILVQLPPENPHHRSAQP